MIVGPIVFMSWGDLAKDSSYTAQAILRTLKMTMEKRGVLGARLVLNLDGTTRENKNKTIVMLLAALVEIGVFNDVWVCFKQPGHTHNEVDQFWSVISNYLKRKGAIDGKELMDGIACCYTYQEEHKPKIVDDMEVNTLVFYVPNENPCMLSQTKSTIFCLLLIF